MSPVDEHGEPERGEGEDTRDRGGQRGLRHIVVEAEVRVADLGDELGRGHARYRKP